MVQNKSFDSTTLESVLRLTCILDDLKTRVRTGWLVWRLRSKRLESVAEHCHSCLILANAFYPIYPDRENIDLGKVNQMLIWHEIGETVIGDVPMIDTSRHNNTAAAEHKAWRKLLKGLPYEQEVYDLLMEFDEHKTPEAKYAYYIDKLDATKSMKRYYDTGKFHRLKWSLQHCPMVRDSKDVKGLVEAGAKTPVDIWFAEQYAPYGDDEFFKEAHRILRQMNTAITPPSL